MQDIWPRGRLVELTPSECWAELADHRVGRLVWCTGGRPHVVPVNYVVEGASVWVRTAPYSRLAIEAAETWVAFEVDDVDEFHHSGISVVVEGRCGRATGAPEGLDTWVEGTRTLFLRLDAESVSGRRLLPS